MWRIFKHYFYIYTKYRNKTIIYQKLDDKNVKKSVYNNDGKKIKEKIFNVTIERIFMKGEISIDKYRRAHLNVEDYFQDMINRRNYIKYKEK